MRLFVHRHYHYFLFCSDKPLLLVPEPIVAVAPGAWDQFVMECVAPVTEIAAEKVCQPEEEEQQEEDGMRYERSAKIRKTSFCATPSSLAPEGYTKYMDADSMDTDDTPARLDGKRHFDEVL
jgi:hypothetical protein